ncbi:MAG: 2Fe-2S iron-sulfur cluster-binding protein [Woeseiaceae bacterium]|nr:2Fe-2S iron-sulfur cluster-binding protein [Woeseiaceae bacterium]
MIPEAGAGEWQVTVVMDGRRGGSAMAMAGGSVVDAAAEQGIDLPYSCKGGVCATCRTLVRSGDVRMDATMRLSPGEVDKGYVLACQSHPTSRELVLDYDET